MVRKQDHKDLPQDLEMLQHQVELEKLVSSISTIFLHPQAEQLRVLMDRALSKIGQYAHVERCYACLVRETDDLLVNTNEWVAEGVNPMQEVHNTFTRHEFDWLHRQLYQFRTVHLPSVADIPAEEKEFRGVVEKMGIKSTLCVPMHYGSYLIGFLGFDSFSEDKHWNEKDIRLLKMVGEIFVNAIVRKNREDHLKYLNRVLEEKVEERTQKLMIQNRKLRNFANYNAHKLRGPLANLMGLVHLLKNGYIEDQEREDIYDLIDQATRSLDTKIREINRILEPNRGTSQDD